MPRDADRLEVWEAAALLGLNEPADDDTDDGEPGVEAGGVQWGTMSPKSRTARLDEIRRRMSSEAW